jgi:hemin uptake protein HemP
MLAKPNDQRPGSQSAISPTGTAPGAARKIRVSDLMANDRHVILEHAGELYILRITAKGRLILTK